MDRYPRWSLTGIASEGSSATVVQSPRNPTPPDLPPVPEQPADPNPIPSPMPPPEKGPEIDLPPHSPRPMTPDPHALRSAQMWPSSLPAWGTLRWE